jgi:hypothetical protein
MTAPTAPGLPNLAAALAKVQAELPKVERDRTVEVKQKNGETYSYSYVTLANLSDAILPLLARHGLAFAAMPGAGADGKMCVRYHLMHESGEALTGEFPVSGDGGIQMIGGRITYARRYCLAAIVGVAADEDDESRLSDDGARGTAQRAAPRPRQQRPAPAEDRPTAQRARPSAAGKPPLPGEAEGVTTSQIQKIVLAFEDLGVADRTDRLRLTSNVAGRELQSAKDLTKAEAHRLIEVIEQAKTEDDPFAYIAASGRDEKESAAE